MLVSAVEELDQGKNLMKHADFRESFSADFVAKLFKSTDIKIPEPEGGRFRPKDLIPENSDIFSAPILLRQLLKTEPANSNLGGLRQSSFVFGSYGPPPSKEEQEVSGFEQVFNVNQFQTPTENPSNQRRQSRPLSEIQKQQLNLQLEEFDQNQPNQVNPSIPLPNPIIQYPPFTQQMDPNQQGNQNIQYPPIEQVHPQVTFNPQVSSNQQVHPQVTFNPQVSSNQQAHPQVTFNPQVSSNQQNQPGVNQSFLSALRTAQGQHPVFTPNQPPNQLPNQLPNSPPLPERPGPPLPDRNN